MNINEINEKIGKCEAEINASLPIAEAKFSELETACNEYIKNEIKLIVEKVVKSDVEQTDKNREKIPEIKAKMQKIIDDVDNKLPSCFREVGSVYRVEDERDHSVKNMFISEIYELVRSKLNYLVEPVGNLLHDYNYFNNINLPEGWGHNPSGFVYSKKYVFPQELSTLIDAFIEICFGIIKNRKEIRTLEFSKKKLEIDNLWDNA